MPPPRDYRSSSESDDIARTNRTRPRPSSVANDSDSHPQFVLSRRSSVSSTATSSCDSPSPQLYPNQHSSCPSDSDSEPRSPLLFVNRDASRREDRRSWSSSSTRRRRANLKGWRITNWMRWLVRLRFFPKRPTTIVRCLISIFSNLLKLKIGSYTHFVFYFCHFSYIAPHLHSQPGQESSAMASVLLCTIACPSIRPAQHLPSHLSQFY